MSDEKKVIIIAGPNGAGKTTFAREFLPEEAGLPLFVNADLIAAGPSPFDPDAAAFRAGRLMIAEIDAHAAAGRSFAFETTLAGHTYLRRIQQWRGNGYIVELIFLSLLSVEEAVQRVATRVRQGGHAVAEEVIRRRFAAVCETSRIRTETASTSGSGTTIAVRDDALWNEGATDERPRNL
jgi:predicted ABC-type ATPase